MIKSIYNKKTVIVIMLCCGIAHYSCKTSNFSPEKENEHTEVLENLKNALNDQKLLSSQQDDTRQKIINIINQFNNIYTPCSKTRKIKYFNCLYEIMVV